MEVAGTFTTTLSIYAFAFIGAESTAWVWPDTSFNSIHYVGKNTVEASLAMLKSKTLFKKNETDNHTFMEARDVSETTIYVVDDKKAIQSYVYYIVNGKPLNPAEDYKKEAFNAYYTNGL